MQFQCAVEELIQGLSVVTRVLSPRTTQQILEGVLIRSCDEGLQLTCSDGMISAVTLVHAQIEGEIDVVAPGKFFLEAVRKMPSGVLVASVDDNCQVLLRSLGAQIKIAGQLGKLFPSLPLVSAENSFILPQAILRDMILQTQFAVALDDPRKVLNGALLEIRQGMARMVALDGFRLAIRKVLVNSDMPDVRAIIPLKTIQEIAKILEDDINKMVVILIGGNQMVVNLGETQFYSTLIEGEYINYEMILPTTWKTQFEFDRQTLLMCVERAMLIAREGKNNLLRMQIVDNMVEITSNSETGDAHDELHVDVEGDDITIAFNVQYIADVMRVLPEERACLQFNSPVSPCMVKPVSGDSFLYLMLPVRVNQ